MLISCGRYNSSAGVRARNRSVRDTVHKHLQWFGFLLQWLPQWYPDLLVPAEAFDHGIQHFMIDKVQTHRIDLRIFNAS